MVNAARAPVQHPAQVDQPPSKFYKITFDCEGALFVAHAHANTVTAAIFKAGRILKSEHGFNVHTANAIEAQQLDAGGR